MIIQDVESSPIFWRYLRSSGRIQNPWAFWPLGYDTFFPANVVMIVQYPAAIKYNVVLVDSN